MAMFCHPYMMAWAVLPSAGDIYDHTVHVVKSKDVAVALCEKLKNEARVTILGFNVTAGKDIT